VSEEELKTCLKSLLRREDFSVPWDLPGSPAKAAALATSGAVAGRSRAERREDSQDLDLVNATVAELLEKLQVKLRGEQQGNKEPSARFLLEDEIPHLQDLLTLCEDFIRWQRFVSHRNGENLELQEPFCSFQHFPAHVSQVLQKVDFTGFEEMPEIPQQRGLAKSCDFTFKNAYLFWRWLGSHAFQSFHHHVSEICSDKKTSLEIPIR
jgi:hypothetical protein